MSRVINEKPTMPDPKAQCVLDAATKVFLQHGFSAATTDMIQREAGVSKATVYNRYSTKETLFSAVIENACSTTIAQVKAIQATSDNLEKTLLEVGRTYLNITLSASSLALFRVVAAEALRFPHMANTFYNAGPRAIIDIMSGHLTQAANKHEINLQTIGVEQAASQFISLLRGEGHMVGVMFPESAPSTVQIERWTKDAVYTFLKAFSTR